MIPWKRITILQVLISITIGSVFLYLNTIPFDVEGGNRKFFAYRFGYPFSFGLGNSPHVGEAFIFPYLHIGINIAVCVLVIAITITVMEALKRFLSTRNHSRKNSV